MDGPHIAALLSHVGLLSSVRRLRVCDTVLTVSQIVDLCVEVFPHATSFTLPEFVPARLLDAFPCATAEYLNSNTIAFISRVPPGWVPMANVLASAPCLPKLRGISWKFNRILTHSSAMHEKLHSTAIFGLLSRSIGNFPALESLSVRIPPAAPPSMVLFGMTSSANTSDMSPKEVYAILRRFLAACPNKRSLDMDEAKSTFAGFSENMSDPNVWKNIANLCKSYYGLAPHQITVDNHVQRLWEIAPAPIFENDENLCLALFDQCYLRDHQVHAALEASFRRSKNTPHIAAAAMVVLKSKLAHFLSMTTPASSSNEALRWLSTIHFAVQSCEGFVAEISNQFLKLVEIAGIEMVLANGDLPVRLLLQQSPEWWEQNQVAVHFAKNPRVDYLGPFPAFCSRLASDPQFFSGLFAERNLPKIVTFRMEFDSFLLQLLRERDGTFDSLADFRLRWPCEPIETPHGVASHVELFIVQTEERARIVGSLFRRAPMLLSSGAYETVDHIENARQLLLAHTVAFRSEPWTTEDDDSFLDRVWFDGILDNLHDGGVVMATQKLPAVLEYSSVVPPQALTFLCQQIFPEVQKLRTIILESLPMDCPQREELEKASLEAQISSIYDPGFDDE